MPNNGTTERLGAAISHAHDFAEKRQAGGHLFSTDTAKNASLKRWSGLTRATVTRTVRVSVDALKLSERAWPDRHERASAISAAIARAAQETINGELGTRPAEQTER